MVPSLERMSRQSVLSTLCVIHLRVVQIGDYAGGLHREVEAIAKKHQKDLASQLDDSKYQLQAMLLPDRLARALLDFGRSEEMVAMSRDVRERLRSFQSVPETQVRQPLCPFSCAV